MTGARGGWPLRAVPATRLASLRLLLGGFAAVYAVVLAPEVWRLSGFDARRWHPVGPLWWMDAPPAPALVRLLLVVVLLAGPAFAVGWRWRVSGPVFAVGFLLLATFRASWGHVLHTDHLVALHLLVLAASPAADAWSADAVRWRRGRRAMPPTVDPRYGWPVQVVGLVTVVTYVLAGIAKVRNGGSDWMAGEVLRNHVAFDNLRKALLGDPWSPIGAAMAAHPWMFTPFALLTVVVELGAPVALLGGRVRTAWCAAAWAFHVGVVAVMAITFPYPVLGFAYLSFFAAERVGAAVLVRLGRPGRWVLGSPVASVRSPGAPPEARPRPSIGGS